MSLVKPVALLLTRTIGPVPPDSWPYSPPVSDCAMPACAQASMTEAASMRRAKRPVAIRIPVPRVPARQTPLLLLIWFDSPQRPDRRFAELGPATTKNGWLPHGCRHRFV